MGKGVVRKKGAKKGGTAKRPALGRAQLLREADDALKQFDYETACAKMEEALKMDANDFETLDKYGEITVSYLGDEERGLQALLKSIEIAPEDSYSKYMTVGQIYGGGQGLQYYKQGAEILLKMLERAGSDAERLELRDAMAQCFCAVAELWTTDLCEEEGAADQCRAALDFAVQQNPNHPEVHMLYAQLYLRLNAMDQSKASLKTCCGILETLDDDHLPSLEIRIEIAKLLMQVDEWQEAYALLKDCLVDDDGNGYLWYLMGECLIRLKKFQRSLRHLLRARGIAQRVAAAEGADPGADGPGAFLASIDTLVEQVRQQLGTEASNEVARKGEEGFVTDSEDEDERSRQKQGEEILRGSLAATGATGPGGMMNMMMGGAM